MERVLCAGLEDGSYLLVVVVKLLNSTLDLLMVLMNFTPIWVEFGEGHCGKQ